VDEDGVDGHAFNRVELCWNRRGRRAGGHDMTQQDEAK
jgi:hypothetical protein